MNRIDDIDEINYIFNIISSVSKEKITISDFCKRWYANKMFKQYNTPEDALYEFFCDKTFDTYTMHIPNLPIVSMVHKNDFTGDINLSNNWNCTNCTNCKWCVDCNNCFDCVRCIKCNKCNNCIDCNDCNDSDYMYKCKHINNSSYVINESNNSNIIGKCDSNCNWNCVNCNDCICCTNCSNCTKCYYSNNCDDCCNMNCELFDKVKKIDDIRDMFDIYVFLDRFSMLSSNCKQCSDCNYYYDGFNINNVTNHIDTVNIELLDKVIEKYINNESTSNDTNDTNNTNDNIILIN